MCLFALISFGIQFCSSRLADAKIKVEEYEGPYLFGGTEYDLYQRVYQTGGYIDEYSNKEIMCVSWIYHPGMSLVNDGVLGFLYLLFLVWLFMGITILADIFMEAIEEITSKANIVMVPDSDGNLIEIEKQVWNPTIANLTLMALGSSAPEIILSTADTMQTLGELPSELGPQAIVGSAAFNLLVISAVSILAV